MFYLILFEYCFCKCILSKRVNILLNMCVFFVNKRVRYIVIFVLILIYVRVVRYCVIIFIDVR